MNSNCLINNEIYKFTVPLTTATKQRAYLDLPKESGNDDIKTIHNLLERQDIKTIQHFLVIYGN